MANSSFYNVSSQNWLPETIYQTIQVTIQEEVDQGLWANQAHTDGWCCIFTSQPQGVNNSWVTYTYQLISDNTQKATVVWPAGWPPPAENINGLLPSHFFSSQSSLLASAGSIGSLSQTSAAPAFQPTYKPAGECI